MNSANLEEDTPRDLKAYAKMHGVGPGWTFLTGKPDDILLLRKSLGFFYNNPKEDADRNNHSGKVVVGTVPLMRWAMCQGGANPKWIATVIQTEADVPVPGSREWDQADRSGCASENCTANSGSPSARRNAPAWLDA